MWAAQGQSGLSTTERGHLQLLRLLEVVIRLLVDRLDVVEEREVLVLLLHEDGHESIEVVDVGHRLELLESILVPLSGAGTPENNPPRRSPFEGRHRSVYARRCHRDGGEALDECFSSRVVRSDCACTS